MSTGTMSSFLSGFKETYAMFLEFGEELYSTGGLSSMDDNSESNVGNSSPNLLKRILSYSLETRYVRSFWVDDWATQKVLVRDTSLSSVR
ncbi:cytochrome P450 CYP82D47-like [Cucumis melo var. makuwa]|uniref:Cytochrome P450 CYP82D47-like n=1 Tax=Cucumis melo var. makuwa TaxID=1194695 RepID=A0A5D3DCS7_CUCMM|nr:cytochrome P450 CYP82D47-like [Cucumis melo var. makuwa]